MISCRSLATFSILLAVLTCVIRESQEFNPFDCCYNYTKLKPHLRNIKGFSIQRSSEVCEKDAIIFKVSAKMPKKGKVLIHLCADPKEKWVTKLTNAVIEKSLNPTDQKKKNRNGKNKGKRKNKQNQNRRNQKNLW